MTQEELHAKVDEFAAVMKQKLDENAHKPGWQNDGPASLLSRVRDEVAELDAALYVWPEGASGPDVNRIVREAADVANFAMMVADVARIIWSDRAEA